MNFRDDFRAMNNFPMKSMNVHDSSKKTLPLTADPILPIHREQLNFQYQYKMNEFPTPLFLVDVESENEIEVLFKLFHEIQKSNKKSHRNPASATYMPYLKGKILVEAQDQESFLIIVQKVFNRIPNYRKLNKSETFDNFCFNLRCMTIPPGSIVRITDPEFHHEPAQVVNVDNQTGTVLVKMYGHIDYDGLLKHNLTSQKSLNLKMPRDYKAKPAPFDEGFFTRHGAKFSIKQLKISMATNGIAESIFWDGNSYVDKFMYIEFSMMSLITMNLNITEDEFKRFQDSHVEWELLNNNFQEQMNRTIVVKNPLNNASPYSNTNSSNFNSSQTTPLSPLSVPDIPQKLDNTNININQGKSKTYNDFDLSNFILESSGNEDAIDVNMKNKSNSQPKKEEPKLSKLDIKKIKLDDLTIGSTGYIKDRHLPCVVRGIRNDKIFVELKPIPVAGLPEAFRELTISERNLITKEKVKSDKIRGPVTELFRADKMRSQITQTFDFAKQERERERKEREKEKKRERERAKAKAKEIVLISSSFQTHPIRFRHLDLVELKSGKVGILYQNENSPLKNDIILLTNDKIYNINIKEIKNTIPNQAYITDGEGKQICLNDNVIYNGESMIVLKMYNKKLFVKNRNTNDCIWISSFDAKSTYQSENEAPEPSKTHGTLIGKKIVKLLNQQKSPPFIIEAVSKNGYLVSSDDKGKLKFKFTDEGKLWTFA
ncbi:hypothetical protein TRFO_38761 [Tritrichomonas foetus]|uniref:NGN domain-containing protein n=1 Tax=Tritrichomonas foetus TaxID=1144522 RepID=A0A1J4J8P7_9EUKA|nr:hypothetical protein TRFO_38761 [Tritrichomonas foetus]|eukprot:OHS95065.1 hypothetical protein TRFO_38761 [Tritrichomonas foetus]